MPREVRVAPVVAAQATALRPAGRVSPTLLSEVGAPSDRSVVLMDPRTSPSLRRPAQGRSLPALQASHHVLHGLQHLPQHGAPVRWPARRL